MNFRSTNATIYFTKNIHSNSWILLFTVGQIFDDLTVPKFFRRTTSFRDWGCLVAPSTKLMIIFPKKNFTDNFGNINCTIVVCVFIPQLNLLALKSLNHRISLRYIPSKTRKGEELFMYSAPVTTIRTLNNSVWNSVYWISSKKVFILRNNRKSSSWETWWRR